MDRHDDIIDDLLHVSDPTPDPDTFAMDTCCNGRNADDCLNVDLASMLEHWHDRRQM